jgi:hypothetical protein
MLLSTKSLGLHSIARNLPQGQMDCNSILGPVGHIQSHLSPDTCNTMCVLSQVELTRTMQQFQQHLQQTALMAQQLLAQQAAGQAARQAGPGSRSNSRPSSAAKARRLSQASNGGSRPGSRGQQRLSGAGAGPFRYLGAGGRAVGAASTQGPVQAEADLLQLEGVLEADEPPSVAEVQAYARYLGMDPVKVSGSNSLG